MSKILVKAEPPLSNKILIRKEGVTVQQLVGGGKKPSFRDFARNTFARRGQGVTGGQRLRGAVGMAGKIGAGLVTAQQTAEAMQGGNLGAGLQAGINYQGMDPTATLDTDVGEKINQNAPALGRKNPVAVQTPAPVPNNNPSKIGVQAPNYSNMPPMHRPIQGVPVPQNPTPAPAPAVPAPAVPALAAPAPAPTTPAPTPAPVPTQAAPAPVTSPLDTTAMLGVGQQPVQQPQPVPPQQQPQPQPQQQPQQVPRPGIPLNANQMRMNGVTGQPASTVNPLPADNPYGWQPQEAPVPQTSSQYSVPYSQQLLSNSPMPTGQAQNVIGGMPQHGVAGSANEMTEGGTPNIEEIQRQGMSNEFKPLQSWPVAASLFTGAIYDKLGPDMVYKMTPHQIGTLSAYMYLKLS